MAEKRKRGQNFTLEEKDKLVKLLLQHKDTLLNKRTDGATNYAKNRAWDTIINDFNSSGNIYRSKDSLMKAWEKMKSESKVYYTALKRSCSQTGGGPSDFIYNPILDQVSMILGRGCTGILGVPDSDAEGSVVPEPSSQIIPMYEADESRINESSCEILCVDNTASGDILVKESVPREETDNNIELPNTPLWSRRRPQVSVNNERTEAVSTLCNSFRDVNKKKADIEDLKRQLLEEEIQLKKEEIQFKKEEIQLKKEEMQFKMEEIQFKKKLYELQTEAAVRDVEIKNEVLKQIRGGSMSLQNIFGIPERKE